MAAYQLPPPTPMSVQGDVAQNWKDFEVEWGHYVVATQLVKKLKKENGQPDEAGMLQVASTLCSVMGKDCLKIMNSLPTLTEADRRNPGRIKDELRAHFVPQRHVLFERYKFNSASQQATDTVDSYLVRLRQLAGSCDLGTLKDSLIRDRLVIGTTDTSTRDRLLRERPVPDLARCAESLRASELSREMEGRPDSHGATSVEFVKNNVRKPQGKGKWTPSFQKSAKKGGKCGYCGYSSHNRSECPACSAKCNSCGKMGHYAVVCGSKGGTKGKVREIAQDAQGSGEEFLGTLTADKKNHWKAVVKVNDEKCVFKLDTGAEVTVLAQDEPALQKMTLEKTTKRLTGPGGTGLSVLGKVDSLLEVGDRRHHEAVYVVEGQRSSLLSKRACEELQLVKVSREVYQVTDGRPEFRKEFPALFTGLGKLNAESYRITLKGETEPVCLYTARKVPHPLQQRVKEELDRMVQQSVISPVEGPTEWCSGMVPVLKPNGKVRVCVNLTALNRDVAREVHPMKTVDDNLAKLQGSTIYSKLDANSGFWQIPLDEKSRILTTFITPHGRYCFNRLPFGISSAPEVFQRIISKILVGLEGQGVIVHMDDILIHGRNEEEHDARVRKVLSRLQEAGVTLNDKCEFSKKRVKFLGHVVSAAGIEVDPSKTTAIRNYPAPTNITELQRFLGMVNQVAKFVRNLASRTEPLRALLRKENEWSWGQAQRKAFQEIKDCLVSTETLCHYDPNRPTVIAADACMNGLGAVLLQKQLDGTSRPVCYASRSLSETEQRYAVIEKEALMATWACEKLRDFVTGLDFELQTDHKPLVPLLSSKDLSQMPPRILRFRMRMMRFVPTVVHVPGKEQITADALSRAPVDGPDSQDATLVDNVEIFAAQTLDLLPASQKKLLEIRDAQREDAILRQVVQYVQAGWPAYIPEQPLLRPYWSNRERFTIVDDLLLYDERLVIPVNLRMDMLNKIHHGHLGMTKCRARAQQSVWWPGLSLAIQDLVGNCQTCKEQLPDKREPLMASPLPDKAWERVGSDLFEYKGKTYLLMIDYYSRWIEVRPLKRLDTKGTTDAMSSIFAVHGVPDIVVSDNGPQYASKEFKAFATNYGFTHVTSSPLYPQSNGEAERAVRTVKNILKKNSDPYLGLMAYRATPLQNGASPCQLLMGREIRTTLPRISAGSVPANIREREERYRRQQAVTFNRRHRATELPTLNEGETVLIRDQNRRGQVIEQSTSPKSYVVQTDQGSTIRRNRGSLIALPSPQPTQPETQTERETVTPELCQTPVKSPAAPVRRSSRLAKKPVRLDL